MKDIKEVAADLSELIKDFDFYGAEYTPEEALKDIEDNPVFVISELIRMVRDLGAHIDD